MQLGLTNKEDFVLVLVNGKGERKIAAWTMGSPHLITVNRASGEKLQLALTQSPQYLVLGKSEPVVK